MYMYVCTYVVYACVCVCIKVHTCMCVLKKRNNHLEGGESKELAINYFVTPTEMLSINGRKRINWPAKATTSV